MRRREKGFYVTIYKKSTHCVRYRDATYDDGDDSLVFDVSPCKKIFSRVHSISRVSSNYIFVADIEDKNSYYV